MLVMAFLLAAGWLFYVLLKPPVKFGEAHAGRKSLPYKTKSPEAIVPPQSGFASPSVSISSYQGEGSSNG